MPRPQRPWFRLYVEATHDRKIRRLKPEYRWLWVSCLAAARQSEQPGHLLVGTTPMLVADVADFAAMSERAVKAGMEALIAAELVAIDERGAWWFPAWNERQFESDEVTKRTAKHRSKDQGRNVPTSFPGTPPETETETETDTEKLVRGNPLASNAIPSPAPLKEIWINEWQNSHAGQQPPAGWERQICQAIAELADPRPDLELIVAAHAREGKHPRNLVFVRNDFYAERAATA